MTSTSGSSSGSNSAEPIEDTPVTKTSKDKMTDYYDDYDECEIDCPCRDCGSGDHGTGGCL